MIYDVIVNFYEIGKDDVFDPITNTVSTPKINSFSARCNITDLSYEQRFQMFGEKYVEVKVLRLMAVDGYKTDTTHCEFNGHKYVIISKEECKGRITLYVRKEYQNARI